MPEPPVEIPAAFLARAESQAGWGDWVARLPRLLRELLEEWQLRPDGVTLSGQCAVVVPVRMADDRPAALKVTWPHWEAETEHLALRAWDGDGAVRLYRADPHRLALLLERLDDGRDLTVATGPRGHRDHRRFLRSAASSRAAADQATHRSLPGLAPSAAAAGGVRTGAPPADQSGRFADGRLCRGAGGRREARPHRSALLQRARRESRGVAGHRPQAAGRGAGVRGGAGALEPLGRGAWRPATCDGPRWTRCSP